MKIALIKSNGMSSTDLITSLPPNTTEIVSLAENDLDESIKGVISEAGIELVEFIMELEKHTYRESLRYKVAVIRQSDMVLAFWDGKNKGTKYLIDRCSDLGIPIRVFV